MNHVGHQSKAIHDAYGRRANMTTLPLEYYETQNAGRFIEVSKEREMLQKAS